jgi:RNA polymerase-binding protein DksA
VAKKVTKKATTSKTAKKAKKAPAKSAKTAKKAATRKSVAAKAAKRAPARKVAKKAAKKPASKAALSTTRAQRILKSAKSPLTKGELKEFRQMLLTKRRVLLGDMNGIEGEALRRSRQDGTGDLSNMPTHPADIGSDNYEQEVALGLLESERIMLGEIDQALERIEEGTYGVCLGTGEPIGQPRLKARPWAKYSIEYARLLEKGLVRPADEQHETADDEDDDDFDIDDEDEADEVVDDVDESVADDED